MNAAASLSFVIYFALFTVRCLLFAGHLGGHLGGHGFRCSKSRAVDRKETITGFQSISVTETKDRVTQ